ncbi:hypothetical protein J437_LFUL016052 [Ladona fulva]|uniref:MYND-type domain-containing protein n=1 Tax=Ladona fulva TaxID=123851 RepID=A0A8K0P5Z9_LADFU|nr:hypothetical protein J437_LFUL016052 [Ladona fulva]
MKILCPKALVTKLITMSIQSLFSGKIPPVLEDFDEGAEFFDKFYKESKHEKKFEVISTHSGLRRILDIILALPEVYDKSDAYAKKLINRGNREFNAENFIASYKSYCHAVPYATGECLVNALEARSSVLLKLGFYKECVVDIKMALEMECSNELKCVLYKRLGLCLTNLKQFKEALDAFRNSDNALQNMKGEMKQLIVSSLTSALTVAKLTGAQVQEKNDELPPLSYGKSQPFLGLSSAVEIRWSESKGREVVANRWIEPGDVLVVEPSFSSVLLKLKVHTDENEARLTRCSECIDSVISPIPCSQCIYVSYCSETCRKNAWEKFHRFECGHSKVLGYLEWTGRLALRMMLAIGETLVAQVAVDVGCYNELSNVWGNDQGDDLNDRQRKRSEQEECYRRIYGMVDHLGKENAWNNFKFHWTAFFISNFLLRKTEFFSSILPKDEYHSPKAEVVKLAVAFRALLHLSQVVVNAMTVQDMWSNPCLLSSVGWGVSHGHDYKEKDWETRARYLKKSFFFDCECEACSSPSHYPEMYFKAHRCLECEGPMLRKEGEVIFPEIWNSEENSEIQLLNSSFQDGRKEKKKSKCKLKKNPQKCSAVEEQKYQEGYLVCQNCKSIRREGEDLQKICEGATFLSQGDYLSAVDCVIQSLPILEKLDFGNMLYAFQLQKLGELIIYCLMQMERSTVFRLKYKRAKECLSSAKEIYLMNGGKWLWVMKELEKQEQVLDVMGHWLKKDNGLPLQETMKHHFPNVDWHNQQFNYIFLYLDYWFSESQLS